MRSQKPEKSHTSLQHCLESSSSITLVCVCASVCVLCVGVCVGVCAWVGVGVHACVCVGVGCLLACVSASAHMNSAGGKY